MIRNCNGCITQIGGTEDHVTFEDLHVCIVPYTYKLVVADIQPGTTALVLIHCDCINTLSEVLTAQVQVAMSGGVTVNLSYVLQ